MFWPVWRRKLCACHSNFLPRLRYNPGLSSSFSIPLRTRRAGMGVEKKSELSCKGAVNRGWGQNLFFRGVVNLSESHICLGERESSIRNHSPLPRGTFTPHRQALFPRFLMRCLFDAICHPFTTERGVCPRIRALYLPITLLRTSSLRSSASQRLPWRKA